MSVDDVISIILAILVLGVPLILPAKFISPRNEVGNVVFIIGYFVWIFVGIWLLYALNWMR